MIDCAFADASRPARCVIARLPMLDYSIGHELLLLRNRNPLVLISLAEFDKLSKPQQIFSIIQAVMICSRTWAENKKPFRWQRLWEWTSRRTDWPLAIAEFRNYRAQGSTMPLTRSPKESEGRSLQGPHLARVLTCVGFSLDIPLGLAQWMYCCEMERQGAMRIKGDKDTDWETSRDEDIARLEAEIRAEQAAKRKEAISQA